MAGWRRAASILDAEEGKTKQVFAPQTDPALFAVPAERALYDGLAGLALADTIFDREGLFAAMTSLGGLRTPIDAFFDNVVVNDDDAAIRANRLGLLAMVRDAMMRLADFTKLEG